MNTFVGRKHEETIIELMQTVKEATIAVAFWGEGSADRILRSGLKPENARIVCNLESGACNPFEIKKLLDKKFVVLTSDRLHAKIYWTERAALVTSANFSANGLGFEGTETASNIEAGILVKDKETLQAIREWLYSDVFRNARTVDEDLIAETKICWKLRRANRHCVVDKRKASDLLDKLRSDEAFFRDLPIYVVVTNGDISKPAQRALKAASEELNDASLSVYENGKIGRREPQPGDCVVDLYFDGAKYYCDGIWKILTDNPRRKTASGYIHLCRKIPRFEGLRLSAKSARYFELRAAALLRSSQKKAGLWGLSDFVGSGKRIW